METGNSQQENIQHNDIDAQSRALIEAMLAEEAHYFGQASIDVSEQASAHRAKVAGDPAESSPAENVGKKWSTREDSNLATALASAADGLARRSTVAGPPYKLPLEELERGVPSRSRKQIQARVKSIAKSSSSTTKTLAKKFKQVLPLFGFGPLSTASETVIQKQFFDQEKVFVHRETEEADNGTGASVDADDDIDIDDDDDDEGINGNEYTNEIIGGVKTAPPTVKKEKKGDTVSNLVHQSNIHAKPNPNPQLQNLAKSTVPKHYTEVAKETEILNLIKNVNQSEPKEPKTTDDTQSADAQKEDFKPNVETETPSVNKEIQHPKDEIKQEVEDDVEDSEEAHTIRPISPDDFDMDSIAIQEVQSLPEWFHSTLCLARGERPHPRTLRKTPDKYKFIRNFIVNSWKEASNKYLSKRAVRPGLKGYGDVNAISRVHEYLEQSGIINVGCYKSAAKAKAAKLANLPAGSSLLSKGSSTRGSKPTKRSILDELDMGSSKTSKRSKSGPKGSTKIAGHNIDDLLSMDDQSYLAATGMSKEDLDAAREAARMFIKNAKWFDDSELEKFNPKILDMKLKEGGGRSASADDGPGDDSLGGYDPFKIIACKRYTKSKPSPFHVSIESNCMILMDFHSHLLDIEIIGLIGGTFDGKVLTVKDVFPCNSVSTGVQCEMDPVSEMMARDYFASKGIQVVGWYHSHPTFQPNPSIRDIENQSQYQHLFRHDSGVEPFIGVIVTPYDPKHVAIEERSQFGILSVSYEFNSLNEYRLPFSCPFDIVASNGISDSLVDHIGQLSLKYCHNKHKIKLSTPVKGPNTITKLNKLLKSLEIYAAYSSHNDEEKQKFLDMVKGLMEKHFL